MEVFFFFFFLGCLPLRLPATPASAKCTHFFASATFAAFQFADFRIFYFGSFCAEVKADEMDV